MAGRGERQSPPFSKIHTFFLSGLYWIHDGTGEKSLKGKQCLRSWKNPLKVSWEKWQICLHPAVNDKMSSRKRALSNAVIHSAEKCCYSKVSTIFVFMSYFKYNKLLRKEAGQEKEHFIDFNILLCTNQQRNPFCSESWAKKRWAVFRHRKFS